jgi:hypothetical protein
LGDAEPGIALGESIEGVSIMTSFVGVFGMLACELLVEDAVVVDDDNPDIFS